MDHIRDKYNHPKEQGTPQTQEATVDTSCNSRWSDLSSILPLQHSFLDPSSFNTCNGQQQQQQQQHPDEPQQHDDGLMLEFTMDRDSDLGAIAKVIQSHYHHSSSSSSSRSGVSISLRGSLDGDKQPDWNDPAAQELIQAIATIPQQHHIECLSFHNFGMVSNSFPICRIVTPIVQSLQHSLTSLQLNCMSLLVERETTELEELASSLLENQRNLKHFSMSYCGFSTTTVSSCSLNPIIRALARLPSLKTVELWSYSEGMLGDLDCDSLFELFGSQSLTRIHLEGFALHNNHLEAIATSLRTNNILESLDLHILKQASPLPLAESLRDNTRLQSLELFCACNLPNDPFLMSLAEVLTIHNASLKSFKVHSYRTITPLEEDAFATMLETNETLQVLDLNGYRGDARPKIDSLLQWNRRGRRRQQFHHRRPLLRVDLNHHNNQSCDTAKNNNNRPYHCGKKKKRSQVDIEDYDIASDLVHQKEI